MRTRFVGLITGLLLATLAACGNSNSTGLPDTANVPPAAATAAAVSGLPGALDTGSDDPSVAGGCTSNIAAQICATVMVTGGSTVKGTAVTTAPMPASADPSTTCSQVVIASDGGNLQLQSVDGHTVTWDTAVTDFHGPGHYPGSEFHLTVDDMPIRPTALTAPRALRALRALT